MNTRSLFIFMFASALFINSALADNTESPTFGTLNAITKGDEGDMLNYECHQQTDGLHCHFEQNIVINVKGSPQTCEIRHHSFDDILVRKADGLWVQSSGPTGVCGAVNTSRFVRDNSSKITSDDKSVFWNYFTQTTITNENGMDVTLPCKKIKESGYEQEIAYKWPIKSEYLGCLYIKH